MTITDFLLARIAEDEAVARAAAEEAPSWSLGSYGGGKYVHHIYVKGPRVSIDSAGNDEWHGRGMRHIAHFDPARILAECEAKRNIVNVGLALSQRLHAKEVGSVQWHEADAYTVVIRTLATAYAGHPDYQQEWAL